MIDDHALSLPDHLDPTSPQAQSPLWMVSQEPVINELVISLDEMRSQYERDPGRNHSVVFSRSHLRKVRAAFDMMIRRGEEALHRLCEVLCAEFLSAYQMQSVVIGQVPSSLERFTLTQLLTPADLYSTIDLDLGNRQLRKLRYFNGTEWTSPVLVANVVEYQPTQANSSGVYKIISRIKAEEELWNKVVDEIFGLDRLVQQDKSLRHLSRYVKDIFGIKIVVGGTEEMVRLHESLQRIQWDSARLRSHGVPISDATTSLLFLEVKDYLRDQEKGSGWEAIKSVVRWGDRTFEIQVQSLGNYWREREILTRESHAGFKSRREEVRAQVAERVPLFRFYQALLRWLIQNPEGPAPVHPGISVAVCD